MNWKKLIPAYIEIKSLYTIEQENILESELKILFDMIDNDEVEKAQTYHDVLRERYGDTISELARAQAMIDFISCDLED